MIFGITVPVWVGLLIEILKKVGIVTNGDQARVANIVLSSLGGMVVSLTAEFNFEAPELLIVVVTAVYSIVVSALGYTVGEKIVSP